MEKTGKRIALIGATSPFFEVTPILKNDGIDEELIKTALKDDGIGKGLIGVGTPHMQSTTFDKLNFNGVTLMPKDEKESTICENGIFGTLNELNSNPYILQNLSSLQDFNIPNKLKLLRDLQLSPQQIDYFKNAPPQRLEGEKQEDYKTRRMLNKLIIKFRGEF